METYIVEIQTKDGKETCKKTIELNPEQVKWIKEGLELGINVPLYATTYAKKKYGDTIIGEVLSIVKK